MFNNIFYFRKLCKIGGTEQFLYEIAKKYNKYDITVFYDVGDLKQVKRLEQYVRVIKRVKGQKVKCKKVFFNFNINMIDDVEAEEYWFVAHANYQELGYEPPIKNNKIDHYLGVSGFSASRLDDYAKMIGKNIKTVKCYNPLTLEDCKKPKILVSACRLNDKVKGGVRTQKLVQALDKYCEENNEKYLWLIFTNPIDKTIQSKNVVIMEPTIDVRPYIKMADYVLQLSNDMETYCYTINEALGYGVPIITTPLSVVKELPIDDNMRIELDWNCENIDEVVKEIFNKEVKEFKYEIPKDKWEDILVKEKSTYKKPKKVKVKALRSFTDVYEGKKVNAGDFYITTEERAKYLVEKEAVKIIVEKKK